MSKLTHLNSVGEANMVDVGDKPDTQRIAVAEGLINMQAETLALIVNGSFDKGDVLAVARVAGIMAAKKTSELVPLCHPLALSKVAVDFEIQKENNAISCRTTVHTNGPTGVEMEALTAVQIALVTIYDMCKAVDRGMTITDVGLVKKSGGKSGSWTRKTSSDK